MLKGYVQATSENVKIGQKCYIKGTGTSTWVHFISKRTFGVIMGDFRDFKSNLSYPKVEVKGISCTTSELVEQTIYLDNLLVEVDK